MNAATAPIQALLAEALTQLSRNQFAEAERLLELALSRDQGNCDALYLYGQMRRVQGRFLEAEVFYKKALGIAPGRPEINHHYGQLLVLAGRTAEALECYREAIRLKSNFVQARLDLGLALQKLEDFVGAEAVYREILQLHPNLAAANQALSAVLIILGRVQEAEAVAREGLAQPRTDLRAAAGLENNLAIALSEQGRHGEALALFDNVQRIVPNLPRLSYNRANTLQSMGRLGEAEAAYRQSIARDPGDLKAHTTLNLLLYRLSRRDFLRSYDDAMLVSRDNPFLPAEKARFLFLAGHYEQSCEAYNRALALAPENAIARDGLASALTRLGRYEDASREFDRVLMALPDHVDARCNYAECLSRAGDPQKALAVVEDALARDPHNQLAIALRGTALRQMGDERENAFNNPATLVQVFDLDPPDGFSDMESFNGELETYLRKLHLDTREHLNQTSRLGTKTSGTLFGAGHDLVERLKLRIDDAVAAYIARMKNDPDHPFFGRKRDGFNYWGSWSTILGDRGFHTNHVHPKGWVSSAYYAAVPDVVRNEEERQGWIKFGEPSFDAGFAHPIRRVVQPAAGRLVLFPSYMWHGTIPFHSTTSRTTIAFDVLPATKN